MSWGWVDLLENYYILTVSMVHKEKRSPLAAARRNMFSEENIRKRRGPRLPGRISSGEVVLFNRSKVEESEEMKKRTPEEKYVYLSHSLGAILDRVDKGVRLSLIRRELKKAGKDGIENFLKAGILELSSEDKDMAVTHRENLINYFKDTDAALVLHEYMKNPGMTIKDVAKSLPLLESTVTKERLKLLKAGFLERKKSYVVEIITLTKYSEGLGIETWGLDGKIEELKSKRRQEAGI